MTIQGKGSMLKSRILTAASGTLSERDAQTWASALNPSMTSGPTAMSLSSLRFLTR